ncbi:MAG: hypothetical protein U1E76_02380 [Planctomycetota bacterium]
MSRASSAHSAVWCFALAARVDHVEPLADRTGELADSLRELLEAVLRLSVSITGERQ